MNLLYTIILIIFGLLQIWQFNLIVGIAQANLIFAKGLERDFVEAAARDAVLVEEILELRKEIEKLKHEKYKESNEKS